MDSGYYAACAGLRAQSQALELIANNLANLNTGGYRAQQTTFHSILATAPGVPSTALNRAINDFDVLSDTRVNLSAGNPAQTGNPLDLAIEGDGFFAVQTKAGTFYTRNGSFHVSSSGQLTTASGDAVLGDQGPLTLPSGTPSISPDGTLSVGGAIAGKVRVVEFAVGTSPVPAGDSYYSVPDTALSPAVHSSIRQGMLESSNVNAVTAAVDLIVVQRRAEMLQKALSSFYSDFNHIAADELPRVS
jgi:flagellar basal-body rod protein FlgF/flagellar basal-body rod protein FlgG